MSTQEKITRKAGRPAGSKNRKTLAVAEVGNDVQVVAESRLEKEINRSVHKTRVPIGRFRDILAVKDLPPGKVGRWVLDNDKGARLQRFLDAGYEFVTQRGLVVGEQKADASREAGDLVSRGSGAYILYLMVIDRDLYEQDQAAKQAEVDKTEAAMREAGRSPNHYGDGLKPDFVHQ